MDTPDDEVINDLTGRDAELLALGHSEPADVDGDFPSDPPAVDQVDDAPVLEVEVGALGELNGLTVIKEGLVLWGHAQSGSDDVGDVCEVGPRG